MSIIITRNTDMPISDSDENDDDEDDEDDNGMRRRRNLYLTNSDDDVDDDDDYSDFYDDNDYNDEIDNGGNSNDSSITNVYNDDVVDDDDDNNNNDDDANDTSVNDEDDEFDNDDNNRKCDNDNSVVRNKNRDDSDEMSKERTSDKNTDGVLEQPNAKSVTETDRSPSKNRFTEDGLEIAKSSKGYYDAYRLYKNTTSRADDYDIRSTEDINDDRSNTLQQSDSTNSLRQSETEHAENIGDDPTDYRRTQSDDSDTGAVASQNTIDDINDDDHQNSLFKYLVTKYRTDSDGETSTATATAVSTNFTNTVTTATAVDNREHESRRRLKEQSLHQLMDNINDNLRPNIKKGLQETKLAIEDVNMKLLEEHTQHLKCNAVVTALFKKRREAIEAGVVVDDLPPLPSADQIERLRKTITVELMIRKLEECKKVNCISKADAHEVNITLLTTMQENQLLCNPIFDEYARIYHHGEDDGVTFRDGYDADARSLRLEASALDDRRFDDEYEKLEYYTNLLNRLLKLKTESLHQWLFTARFLRRVMRGVVRSITSENDGKKTASHRYDSDESYDMGSYDNNNVCDNNNDDNNTIPTRESDTRASEFFWYSGVELFFSFVNERIQSYITGVSKDVAELAIRIGIPLIMIQWTGSFKTSKAYKSLLKRSINNIASIIIEPSLFILGNMLKENRNDDAEKWTTSKTKRAIGDLADRHGRNVFTVPKNVFLHNYETVDPDALTLTAILEKDISVGRDIRKHVVSYLYKNRKTFSMLLVRGVLEIKKSVSSLVARYVIHPPSSLSSSSSSVLPSRTLFSSTESDLDIIANRKRSSSNVRKQWSVFDPFRRLTQMSIEVLYVRRILSSHTFMRRRNLSAGTLFHRLVGRRSKDDGSSTFGPSATIDLQIPWTKPVTSLAFVDNSYTRSVFVSSCIRLGAACYELADIRPVTVAMRARGRQAATTRSIRHSRRN
ncbi:protein PFC0760c-like [Penaeus indicus]|uniref:protein PFC0760c-like n=1 Tax=Penaeus indicus TaxID=29960 RepID=UPI00300C444F